MVSFYSPPHGNLLELSYNTLLSCIPEKSIHSVVVMTPHLPFPGNMEEQYFVVEKPGLDAACLGGSVEVFQRRSREYYIWV
jgi:hypothetical protein